MDSETERGIEWDVQKVLRQYYHHVDQREYDKATALFTPDVDWDVMGLKVNNQEDMLEALQQSLGSDTIRHVLTNTVVTVVDENHATARSYNTLYYTADTEYRESDNPLAMEGPHRLLDSYAELTRTSDGWRISKRRSLIVFRRDPDEPVPLETWGESEGRTSGDA